MDKEELSNYRSISNLSIISKIIEHVVKSHLMDHLTSNSLLNSHQSVYCKHHSTETALLYLHDHLVSAIRTHKVHVGFRVHVKIASRIVSYVSCLCLLDLSAAFDTTDHILILVWYPWLCFQLVQIISVILLLPCQMWNRPVFLVHILLRCPPRLCPWSFTLRYVYHSSQYSHFLSFPKPSSLCRRYSTLPFLSSSSLSPT